MDDSHAIFNTIQECYRRLVRRFGNGIGRIPYTATKGLQDALDGIGLYEPGWA